MLYELKIADNKFEVIKKLVFKLLKEYQKEKKLTIILITHNLEETLFSDRIIVLENGKIIKDETKEEIYKNDYLERKGFELPFVVKLSQNLILYDFVALKHNVTWTHLNHLML